MTRKGSHLKVFDIHKHPKDFLSSSIYSFTRLEKATLLCFFPFFQGSSQCMCQTLALLICASWCPYPLLLFLSAVTKELCVPINGEECHSWNFQLPVWKGERDTECAPAPPEVSSTSPFSRSRLSANRKLSGKNAQLKVPHFINLL